MIRRNDPARWKERADGRMVHEDHTAMANLSPVGFQREIPYRNEPDAHPPIVADLQVAFFQGVKGKR